MAGGLNAARGCALIVAMSNCRILYFRGGILEASEDAPSADLVEAAQTASSRHPHLTAEIWREGKKVGIVRPSWEHHSSHRWLV